MEYIFFLQGSTVYFIPVHYFNLRAGGQEAGYGIKGPGWGGGRGSGGRGGWVKGAGWG